MFRRIPEGYPLNLPFNCFSLVVINEGLGQASNVFVRQ
jgi:hypothetical protein